MPKLDLLSGGAAQALVQQLQPKLQADSGFGVEGTFGAVGAMKEKLLAGAPCDVVILTQAIVDELVSQGHVVQGSATPLGVVRTGVAVKAGAAQPDVSTPAALKAALLAASGIFFPDPVKATAGIHCLKVMRELGVADELAGRFHVFPNGAAAMGEMAKSGDAKSIGCTQVTEILFAEGVDLVGLLPKQFELATVYTAAVAAKAQHPDAAGRFIAMLASDEAKPLREAGGFEAR